MQLTGAVLASGGARVVNSLVPAAAEAVILVESALVEGAAGVVVLGLPVLLP